MNTLQDSKPIYDWNTPAKKVEIIDASLREGIQHPSVRHPSLDERKKFIDILAEIGVDAIDIGLPMSSEEHKKDVIGMAKYIREQNYPINITVIARTVKKDIDSAIEVSNESGAQIEALTVVGSSNIRQLVENWNIDKIRSFMQDTIPYAVKNGILVNFATEDTTRSTPDTVNNLYSWAVELGAYRLLIADTVGFATPSATRKIVRFFKDNIIKNSDTLLDWHGHNDRNLSTANSITAIEEGVDRVHACSLGIGERSGNDFLEVLLANMEIMGLTHDKDLTKLSQLSEYSSKIFDIPIPEDMPVVGKYVFTTSAGIHASAVMKARNLGREDLANQVYAGINPVKVGRKADIVVGPLSGKSNVVSVLKRLEVEPEDELVTRILDKAYVNDRILTDNDIIQIYNDYKSSILNEYNQDDYK